MRYTGFGKVSIFGKSPHPVSNLTQGRNSGFLLPANLPEAKGRAAEQTLAPICAKQKAGRQRSRCGKFATTGKRQGSRTDPRVNLP